MRYNTKLNSDIVIVTNGITHFYFKFNNETKKYQQEKDLILYKQ